MKPGDRAAGAEEAAHPAGDPPCVQWIGHDSHRDDAGFVLVRDEADWRELWAEHTGVDLGHGGAIFRHLAPLIDFDRFMVVGYFRGRTVNGDGERAESVTRRDGAVVVRFVSSTFQTFGFDERCGAVDVQPFGLWVIPRSERTIIIEEGRRGLKDSPIAWREVHRFEQS